MAAQVSPTAVGTLLNGTYRLERVIAEGGMGVVYEAQHLRLPRHFAVKILAKPVDSDTSLATLARFRREADIASALQHPHIVEVFDYQVSESGSPYLVMEMLEGEDLADRLKKGRVAVTAALRIITEIAEALDCAHTGGVVHRDLKPANIFLTRRGAREDFVKVLDFGVSKLIDSATLTQEKAMVGTPLYMSPEQAIGTQELTPESDIFSLGAISFEILTGRRAFAASSIPSILYQIVHGPTPKLAGKAPGLSTAVDEVFARVLAKRKEERYKRATQFAEDLRHALGRDDAAPARALPLDDDALAQLAARESSAAIVTGVAEVTGAADTELDSSTRADEAMAAVGTRPGTRPGTPVQPRGTELMVAPETVPPQFERSLTANLRATRPRTKWLMAAILAAVAIGGGVALVGSSGKPDVPATLAPPAATPVALPAPSTPEPDKAAVEAPAPPAAKRPEAPVFEPEPIQQHGDVQFVFHVWPRGAEIFVDDDKVAGSKLTLPYQQRPHRVVVRAAGYHTLSMSAPSTANRTFELRLDRIVVERPKRPPPPKKPAHDAAPVQDL